MLKRLALVTALLTSSAWAQQEVSITAADIESGAADAKLAEMGRQAAATGKEVVINAPKEWHGKVAAKIKAGGQTEVKMNDSFFENVVVRVSDKSAPKPVEAAKPVEAPKPPVPAAKPVEAPKPPPTPVAKPVAPPPPPPAPAPKPVEVIEPVEAAPSEPVRVIEQPAPAPPPPPVAPPKPSVAAAVDPSIAIKQRFETSLNEGKPARGEITALQLQKDDLLYIDGAVRAIVRRDRLGANLYWLGGELNLQRAELKPLAENRYQVIDKLTGSDNVSLRGGDAEAGPQVFTAKIPDDNSPERAEMEKAYAEGRSIGRGLRADQLIQGDLLYVGKSAAVIVRRDGTTLARYWLDGAISTNQRGLQKEKDGNKYKVLSDNIE